MVIARNRRTLGIGAGQMSRIDSVNIALSKVGTLPKGVCSLLMSSFPSDALELAADGEQ